MNIFKISKIKFHYDWYVTFGKLLEVESFNPLILGPYTQVEGTEASPQEEAN